MKLLMLFAVVALGIMNAVLMAELHSAQSTTDTCISQFQKQTATVGELTTALNRGTDNLNRCSDALELDNKSLKGCLGYLKAARP